MSQNYGEGNQQWNGEEDQTLWQQGRSNTERTQPFYSYGNNSPQDGNGYHNSYGFNQNYVNNGSTQAKTKNIVPIALCSAFLGGLLSLGGASLISHGNFASGDTHITNQKISQTVNGGINWEATAKTTSPSVVTIEVQGDSGSGEGSGVIYDNSGHIITNNHVSSVAGADGTIQVRIGNQAYRASVVGSDPAADIAVLKISGNIKNLVPIEFADSSKVKVGEQVMAVGSPLGYIDTATTGIVSALQRPIITQGQSDADTVITNAIQTSAPINPGNSGGALVDKDGQLVGINSSIATLSNSASNGGESEKSGSIGIGFAIPSNQVKNTVQQILSNGSVKHAYLGVKPTPTIVSNDNNSGTIGVKIDLIEGSPASKSALKSGDVITSFNGHATTTSEELVASVRELNPGDKAEVKYLAKNSTVEKSTIVTLGTAPK